MEMAEARGYSYSQSEWDGNFRDVVSVLIYSHEKGMTEVQLLVRETQGIVCLPRKEVTNGGSRQGEAVMPSLTQNSWCNDVDYGLIARRVAVKMTNGSPSHFSTPRLVLLTQIYVPSLHRQYHHYVFAVKIARNEWIQIKDGNGCRKLTLTELRCIPRDQLERQDIVLVAEHASDQLTGQIPSVGAIVRHTAPHQVWREVDEAKRTNEDEIVSPPEYNEQGRDVLFEEFVRCGYPHSTVCHQDMKPLLSAIGWKDKEKDIFRAMNYRKTEELDAREFITGLAAMDQVTRHRGKSGELRCQYIFRYYAKNNIMEMERVKAMVQDIAKVRGDAVTEDIIEVNVKKAYKILCEAGTTRVTLKSFLIAAGSLSFRGTSQLFRASNSIIPYLMQKDGSSRNKRLQSPVRSLVSSGLECPASAGLQNKKLKKNHIMDHKKDLFSAGVSANAPVSKSGNDSQDVAGSIPLSAGALLTPASNKYTLAHHTVKVRRSGQITDIRLLHDMERDGEVCDTGFHADGGRHRVFDRFESVEAFNRTSLPNEMFTALRYFEHERNDKAPLHWGEVDMTKLAHFISSLCSSVKDLFENEARLLRLTSPCYILGDLHGNYRDLMCFEKVLWRVGPGLTPANFLFLGDYVDRGDYGIEVVSYLFSQKLLNPTTFFLLRGNHEVREIQKAFTFQKECITKFGEELGMKVWSDINDVFDRMPLSAVIDEKMFCIHGGIPKLEGNLEVLEKIHCPLPNPEYQNNLAWQMMWNDPVKTKEMTDGVQMELKNFGGFAYNEKRKTANVFNEIAFKNFLEKHGLTHVVRAHEVKQAGFEIQEGGQLLTVFSSSHYCGGSNEAACILVNKCRIRIIRVDTS